jgi:hypothetical protein
LNKLNKLPIEKGLELFSEPFLRIASRDSAGMSRSMYDVAVANQILQNFDSCILFEVIDG